MLKGLVDMVKDSFVALKKLNPLKWAARADRSENTKAIERHSTPALSIRVPKRLRDREEDDDRSSSYQAGRLDGLKRRR
jgi:hypothetical protein